MAKTESEASKGAAASPAGELTCPECGRTFTRPAALGAHRRLTHGVAGASSQQRSRASGRRRTRAGSAAATGAASGRSTGTRRRGSSASGARARRAAPAASSRNQGVDRDALLQTLFPAGIPARESVIRSVNSWLDEAERLARMR